MSKEKKKGFVLYYDYMQHLSLLSNEECGLLFKSLFEYGENGNIPQLEGAALMAFSFIRAQMDRDALKYEEICQKRLEAGKKGGRPSNNTNEKPNDFSENQIEPKKPNGFSQTVKKAQKYWAFLHLYGIIILR